MKQRNEEKNSKSYKNIKKYRLNFRWVIVLFIFIFMLSLIYINYINKLIEKNVYNNITELSQQTATQLNLAITDQKYFVQMMADTIDMGFLKSPEEIFERYSHDLENYFFTRLVILDENGNGSTSDGHLVQNYKDIDEFFNTTEGVYLSENRPSTVSNNQVNIYSAVININGEKMVLMATINTSNYKEILLRRLFGKGGTYLINNDGYILIDSFDKIKESNVNFFDYIKNEYNIKNARDVQKIYTMASEIKNKNTGTFDVKVERETCFIHYEKVNINDWYVVTVATDNTIAKDLLSLVIVSLGLCLFINFVIIAISIYIDLSNYKQNRRLFKVAYVDPITGLGNEVFFKENASSFLQSNENNKYIVSIDINKFKALNNIYGYEYCNKILRELGRRLREILPSDNITCRTSNDIFASIFSYQEDIKKLLDTIFHDASNLKLEDLKLHLNLSIGVYKISDKDTEINKVLDKATMARAKIKGLYDNNYYIFDDVIESKLLEEQKIESSMEEALENHEFKVVYQPKTITKTEKVTGAEALVRWYKDGEIIPPDKFIPLFEENKFIIKLDLYIFEQVCQDMKAWKEKYGFTPIIAVNVSKTHFIDQNFIKDYVRITDKYNIDRNKIDLEITESATIDGNIDTIKILNNIKEQGFTISIDDFGTGYSSLSMIQSMPIDVIKIDKIFVDKADLNSEHNIINYIMIIAKHLGVKTIVEGVETLEQVEFVRKIECDVIQGYYYSKPIPREEFEEYFNKNT